MRKYIQRDLRKYVDYEIIRELEKCQYSQRADRSLQSIFTELIRRLDELESESSEKDSRLKALSEALTKQQRVIIRRNEAEASKDDGRGESPTTTRNGRIREMYAQGFSQRQIAIEVGLSQQRVKEIIKQPENPLFTFDISPENFLKFAKNGKGECREERDLKICEWWDMGYTQKQIAEGTGLSRSRISQIVLKKCTQVQKTNTLTERAKKNGVHRNTQAKIEKIRKAAPWLAEQCETGETSVRSAFRLIEEMLPGSAKKAAGKKPEARRQKERL